MILAQETQTIYLEGQRDRHYAATGAKLAGDTEFLTVVRNSELQAYYERYDTVLNTLTEHEMNDALREWQAFNDGPVRFKNDLEVAEALATQKTMEELPQLPSLIYIGFLPSLERGLTAITNLNLGRAALHRVRPSIARTMLGQITHPQEV